MSLPRFGIQNDAAIVKIIEENTPKNTVNSKKYTWKIFMEFCDARIYELDGNRTLEELALILKDWAINMRKKDSTEFKEATVKTVWNITSKLLQEKYYKEYNIMLDPFKSVAFKQARNARDAARRNLQTDPTKRKTSSVPLTSNEMSKIINFWDENTPIGLLRKFYHIATVELAWRGGEGAACLVDYFHIEKDNNGSPTNRIECNPIFSKTCQGGSKNCASSKWPNRHWKTGSDNWYDNMPLGRNIIDGWTKSSAEAIGLDTKQRKITNHSNRATAVSQLAKSGVQEQHLLKITGHNNGNSIKPYLNIDQEHHNQIINIMRGNTYAVTKANTARSTEYHYTNCSFNNCVFNK
ncbi:uncharacterized protein [Leptinotarsa decemlineata]|uniref:uncharacterized protein n=1 Tax=Leptinotarsa decemlineata TaxID=7539 RepID=UPI003D30A0B7